MSPLWPDFALARAAWAKAVDSGLVQDSEPRRRESDEGRVRLVPQRPHRPISTLLIYD
jgi:hypothetical protein